MSLNALLLRATVFYSGVVILAVRILSPYFGNTIFNFSSVISVILAALSVGYWFGGRLAHRNPSQSLFYLLVTVSGFSIILIQLVSDMVLPTFGATIPSVIGPLISSLFLFFVPACIFGLLSPFVIKLASIASPNKGVGTIAGEIFFFSTLGSICGSLSAGFILIPLFGISASMIAMGSSLMLVGAIGVWRSGMAQKELFLSALLMVSLAMSALIFSGAPRTYLGYRILYDDDGRYGRVVVGEGQYNGRPVRLLFIDHSFSSGIALDGDPTLPFPYMQFFSLYRVFSPEPDHVLVLGSATNAVPKMLLSQLPEVTIDAVEIEPTLAALGERYFDAPHDPRLRNHVADGRQFVARHAGEPYDVIVGDAYHSMYSIPAHMVTKEFYSEVYGALATEGAYLMNVISMERPEEKTMLFSTEKTMREVFDEVFVFAVQDPGGESVQNFVLVGLKREMPDLEERLAASSDPFIQKAALHLRDLSKYKNPIAPIFTDDFAPTDALTGAMLLGRELGR